MKFKYFILILSLFLISGCSAEVNLTIDKNSIDEDVNITFYEEGDYTKELINSSFRNYIPIYLEEPIVDTEEDLPFPNVTYYQKKTKDLGNGYLFNYKYNFDIDKYKEARTIKGAFKRYDITTTNNILNISTDSGEIIYFNDYPLLDKITVNIKTDYLVLEHNADRVNNNIYTFEFTKDSRKSINMKVNLNKNTKEQILGVNYSDLYILGIIIIIIILISLYLIIKNRNNNKI